jgi:two-component system, sensor histidine kinase and response regulator
VKIPTILVVDDQPDNFDIIETLLADHNYELYYAASGHNAFELLETLQPDLILLDVMMPEIDGLQVCREIKANPKFVSIPIVMVTALNSKEDLAHCLKSGADDFISKPINRTELQARVHSMLRIKQQYDEIHDLSQIQAETISLLETSLNTLRTNLVASLPHELNTPLNGILGGLNLLLFDLDDLPAEEIRELLEISQSAALRLESVVQRILLYLQLELTGQIPQQLRQHTSRLSLVIETSLTNHADRVKRQDDVRLSISATEIQLPPSYCHALFNELIDNAFKFSTPGTPIHIISNQDGRYCEISICSYGRMMTPEQIEAIGAFMQFDRKLYEQQGLGLGLKIVQSIVKASNGSFSIQSTPPDQTTIHLKLPVAVAVSAV